MPQSMNSCRSGFGFAQGVPAANAATHAFIKKIHGQESNGTPLHLELPYII
jgi:hypothetical protein